MNFIFFFHILVLIIQCHSLRGVTYQFQDHLISSFLGLGSNGLLPTRCSSPQANNNDIIYAALLCMAWYLSRLLWSPFVLLTHPVSEFYLCLWKQDIMSKLMTWIIYGNWILPFFLVIYSNFLLELGIFISLQHNCSYDFLDFYTTPSYVIIHCYKHSLAKTPNSFAVLFHITTFQIYMGLYNL